jgi:hypothetical protein
MLNLKITNSNGSLPFYTPVFRIYKDTITESENLPSVIRNGNNPFAFYFSYYPNPTGNSYTNNHILGQTDNNDFDQYAIYFVLSFNQLINWTQLDIMNLGGVNYFSMNFEVVPNVFYYNSGPNNFVTCLRQAVTSSPTPLVPPYSFTYNYYDSSGNIKNPFQPGNTATSCFASGLVQGQQTNADNAPGISPPADITFERLPVSFANAESGLGVYRPSKNNSTPWDDCFVTNLCAPTYLYIQMQGFSSLKYGMITIKTPDVYIGTECVDFYKYDVLYYSVSCILDHTNPNVNNLLLPFWTVNGRMLSGIKTKDGYAYIVWAPHDEVVYRKANPQPGDIVTKDYEPPIVTTKDGNYAYLLQQSDYYYNFRFQEANPNWEGNPVNAQCYNSDTTNQPISNQLGTWCPQVQGSINNIFF